MTSHQSLYRMANWKLDQNCFQMYPGIVCYSCDKVVWLFGEMRFCLNRCLGCVYVSPLGRLPVSPRGGRAPGCCAWVPGHATPWTGAERGGSGALGRPLPRCFFECTVNVFPCHRVMFSVFSHGHVVVLVHLVDRSGAFGADPLVPVSP